MVVGDSPRYESGAVQAERDSRRGGGFQHGSQGLARVHVPQLQSVSGQRRCQDSPIWAEGQRMPDGLNIHGQRCPDWTFGGQIPEHHSAGDCVREGVTVGVEGDRPRLGGRDRAADRPPSAHVPQLETRIAGDGQCVSVCTEGQGVRRTRDSFDLAACWTVTRHIPEPQTRRGRQHSRSGARTPRPCDRLGSRPPDPRATRRRSRSGEGR